MLDNLLPQLIFTLCASCGTVYCNRSCLFVCGWVCVWVCYHDNSKLRSSILNQSGFVGKGSDHLQLMKFWLSHAPRKGVCSGVKIFWLGLNTVSTQCLHLLWALFSFLSAISDCSPRMHHHNNININNHCLHRWTDAWISASETVFHILRGSGKNVNNQCCLLIFKERHTSLDCWYRHCYRNFNLM